MMILGSCAAMLVLIACGAKEVSISVPDGAQAGELWELQATTYEASKVEYDADRGILVVPENRDDPGSRLIALPVIRIRALSDDPDEPIFCLEGGPGQSNMHFRHLAGLVDDQTS